MNADRWRYTSDYLREVFGAQDAHLAGLMHQAVAAGLPPIAVSADVGRLLQLLTSMTPGRLALELGTLAGYSAIWLARGLAPGGRLITVELDEDRAAFAEAQIARAGLAERVEVRRGAALDALDALREELAPGSVDVLFLDAVKRDYLAYFERARPLLAVGGLVIADNALGSSAWWIDHEGDPEREGAHALNERLASDPDFIAAAVPLREGLAIARRVA
jgi:predicted O-methyltransferase YrrM